MLLRLLLSKSPPLSSQRTWRLLNNTPLTPTSSSTLPLATVPSLLLGGTPRTFAAAAAKKQKRANERAKEKAERHKKKKKSDDDEPEAKPVAGTVMPPEPEKPFSAADMTQHPSRNKTIPLAKDAQVVSTTPHIDSSSNKSKVTTTPETSSVAAGGRGGKGLPPKKKVKAKLTLEPQFPAKAIAILQGADEAHPVPKRKFDETMELALNLFIDPKKQDQQLRMMIDLPYGTGKQTKICVFTTRPEVTEVAKKAGADVVGGAELVEGLVEGKIPIDFDKTLATPDALPILTGGKVAKLLGPKGLLPNKKLGNIVEDVEAGIKRARAGQAEVRVDRFGIIHLGFGKKSMPAPALLENLRAVLQAVDNNKPAGVKGKGKFFKSAFLATSMSPSVPLVMDAVDPKKQTFMASASS